MIDLAPKIVLYAKWAVINKSLFRYLEDRPFPLYIPTPSRPISNDCSATSIWCAWMAGIPEPFPKAYSGIGDTESFLALQHVVVPRAGDFVVYGEGLPLSVQHMAVVVTAAPDPITMTHGDSNSPAFVPVSRGCPAAAEGRVSFIRINTLAPDPIPPAPISSEVDEMHLVKNPHNGGMCLVHGDRWSGIPNPDAEGALVAQGIGQVSMTPAQFDTLKQVTWGSA